MNDKRRPIEERIAELFGRTAYRDLREGVGGTRTGLTTADIAAQLGYIQQTHGPAVLQAMETYYGSTLIHEEALRRTWEAFNKEVDINQDYEATVLSRFGCALAVRRLAGMDYSTPEIASYAWMIARRRAHLQLAITVAESWLDELWMTGLNQLRNSFKIAA